MTDTVTISKAEISQLMSEAVEKGVQKAFLNIGVDITTPEAVIEAQKDFQHVRAWRRAKDTAMKQGIVYTTGVIITGIIGALYLKYGGGK
jgi:hypothetical protein